MNDSPALSPDDVDAFVQRRLSLRHLRTVAAVSAAGSLSAAAESLHVTQPAVSKALGEIERGLGQTLFVRRGRNMVATLAGVRMIQLAQQLDANLRRGAESMASLARGASGEVLIGATNVAMAQVMPDAIMAMKQQYPNVTLSIRSYALKSLIEELRAGQLDLVVARIPVGHVPDDLLAHRLSDISEVLVMSALHPLAKSRQLSWDTLNQQAWLWPLPGTRSRALQDRLWSRMGLSLPTNLIETGDNLMSLNLMRRTPLLGIMSKPAAVAAAKQGALVILPLKVDLGLSGLTLLHQRDPSTMWVERFRHLMQLAANEGVSPTEPHS